MRGKEESAGIRECDMRELQIEANVAERIGISSCSDGNEVLRRISE